MLETKQTCEIIGFMSQDVPGPIDPLREEREEGIHDAALRDLGIRKPTGLSVSRPLGTEKGVRGAFDILDIVCPGWEDMIDKEGSGASNGAERRGG